MFLKAGNGTLTHKSGTLRYTLHKRANETLESGGIQEAVNCPDDVDPNEWIAVHTIDFYNDINLLFGVVQEECTNYSCPIMSAGESFEFLWTDKHKYKKPTRLPAKVYIDYLMNWIVRLLEDNTLFPVEPNVPFPRDYIDKVRNIFRRMFRVYAHIYYSHMILIKKLDLENQFNFCLCHFICFSDKFNLVGPTDIRPLKDLVCQLLPNLRLTKEMISMCEKRESPRALEKPIEPRRPVSIKCEPVGKVVVAGSGLQPFGGGLDMQGQLDMRPNNNYSNANETSLPTSADYMPKTRTAAVSAIPRQGLVTSNDVNAMLFNKSGTRSTIYSSSEQVLAPAPNSPLFPSAQPFMIQQGESVLGSMHMESGAVSKPILLNESFKQSNDMNPEDELSRQINEVAKQETQTVNEHLSMVDGEDENKCDCTVY